MSEELVAGGAVALMGAYLRTAGDGPAAPARDRLGRIHALIRDGVGSQGDYARAILKDVEDNPAAEDPQAALAAVAAQQAVNDPQFRRALDEAVEEAVADDAVVELAERVAVGSGRDLLNRLRQP